MTAIRKISLQACRGFLERREIAMSAGKRPVSVCVFGDNGSGKSSIADAIEFFFAADGLIGRLKKKQNENFAGASALVHARAASRKVRTEVEFELADGSVVRRTANGSGTASELPNESIRILETSPVPMLMRSWEMKTFVADVKGADRYTILARWVGLSRLTELQDALTKIEGKIRKDDWRRPTEAKAVHDRSIETLTNRKLQSWSAPALVKWINGEITSVTAGRIKTLAKLSELERVEAEIEAAQSSEATRSLLAQYETVVEALRSLSSDESPFAAMTRQSAHRAAAHADVERLKEASSNSGLLALWSEARDHLTAAHDDHCPVCSRPFDAAVSRKSVLTRLEKSLAGLQALSEAEDRLKASVARLTQDRAAMNGAIAMVTRALENLDDPTLSALRDALSDVKAAASQSKAGPSEFDRSLRSAIDQMGLIVKPAVKHASTQAERLRKEAGSPYAALLVSVSKLIDVRDEWTKADAEERQLERVAEQYKMVAAAIRAEVRAHVKAIIEQLESDVRAIYAALRGNDEHVPVVDVDVSDDKKSMSVTVSLFGVEGVPPSGYLSDSQLNSLGLAIYLAAVRRFNAGFPFVVLDDIMSSYDASHRLNLVHVIDQYLQSHQVIVTTHDEVFFSEMKAALASNGNWHFLRLKPWMLETGVRFQDDVPPDEDIERRLRDGEPAEVVAQLMMSTAERWLCERLCDGGGAVKLKIKKDGSVAPATIGQLWSAAQEDFDESAKAHPSYAILRGHAILNWPRHAGTNGKLKVSIGELETFWKHYKSFRAALSGSPPSMVR